MLEYGSGMTLQITDVDEYSIAYGKTVRCLRQIRGLSIEELAEKAKMTGKTIGAIENCKTCNPRLDSQVMIGNALQVDQVEFSHAVDYTYRCRNEHSVGASKRLEAYMEKLSNLEKEKEPPNLAKLKGIINLSLNVLASAISEDVSIVEIGKISTAVQNLGVIFEK